MHEEFYKGISISGVNPDHFPDVAVYIKTGSNYMLYKPHGQRLTDVDHDRLLRRGAEYLYIRTGDMDVVSEYQESNLSQILQRKDMDSGLKGKIIYQTSVDYMAEVFETPEKIKNMERSKNLVRQIARYVTSDKEALESLKLVALTNPYNVAHSVQVAVYAILMHVKIFQLSGRGLEDVGIGALFCDLGMSFNCADLLNKSESLSFQEYHQIKQHATMGYDFMKRMRLFSEDVLSIVHFHHERYDGKGYPARLVGDSIPQSAKILALCDSFCAMTSDRSYRKAVTPIQALHNMKESTGAYDVNLFEKFEKIIVECLL